ncbi:hypothetical protein TNCV_3686071 [Trichonephila clavipes]|nr:hypothetical protein TNCV_3686071 [Trichonephila clavipes]
MPPLIRKSAETMGVKNHFRNIIRTVRVIIGSSLDRFNVHRCPTRRVFSGTGLEPVTKQATVRYLYHSATTATLKPRNGDHFDPIIITSTKFAIQRFLELEKLFQPSFHFPDISRTRLQGQYIVTDNRRAAENFVVEVASAANTPDPPVIIPYGKDV